MKLEQLVPPLEMCQQIPGGEFSDSALVWWGASVYPRIRLDESHYGDVWHQKDTLPAPTLAEILLAIEQEGMCWPTIHHHSHKWTATCEEEPADEDFRHNPAFMDVSDPASPAAAALKLWMEVHS